MKINIMHIFLDFHK